LPRSGPKSRAGRPSFARSCGSELLVLDIGMPRLNGIEVAARTEARSAAGRHHPEHARRRVLHHQGARGSRKDARTRKWPHKLNVGLSTVETHRANLMQKLNLYSTAEIVLCAVRKGIIV
jgi:DNA-binding NarL/FixJ family response regulator